MFDHKEKTINFKVINIIIEDKSKDFTFNDDLLYPDDTNNMIINKIINYCYPNSPISVNEIYAYSGDNSICFEYDNIGQMNHIIHNNEVVSAQINMQAVVSTSHDEKQRTLPTGVNFVIEMGYENDDIPMCLLTFAVCGRCGPGQ